MTPASHAISAQHTRVTARRQEAGMTQRQAPGAGEHDPAEGWIVEQTGEYVGAEFMSDADARRIVACVNACAGIPTEALEAGALGEVLRLMKPSAALTLEDLAREASARGLQLLCAK